MLIFQNSFNQKFTASLLIICIIGMAIVPTLLYPKQAKADIPVRDYTHIALQTMWEVLKSLWRATMEVYTAISAYIDMWTQSMKILEWWLGVALNILLHQLLAQLTNDS